MQFPSGTKFMGGHVGVEDAVVNVEREEKVEEVVDADADAEGEGKVIREVDADVKGEREI